MFANFATALPTGAAMTFLILYGMQALISMQPGAAVEPTDFELQPWLYVPPVEDVNLIDFDPKEIPEVMPAPPTEQMPNDSVDSPVIKISHRNPLPSTGGDVFNGSGFSDGPLVAIIRVQPNYPGPMAARGIEGSVTVIFDVLPDGSVTNIAVLHSSHGGFERSAIRAASQFKFKARVVDGVPQPSSGIQFRFTYQIDK